MNQPRNRRGTRRGRKARINGSERAQLVTWLIARGVNPSEANDLIRADDTNGDAMDRLTQFAETRKKSQT